MTRYQKYKNAIEVFQSKEIDGPFIISNIEINEKVIKALVGRNI